MFPSVDYQGIDLNITISGCLPNRNRFKPACFKGRDQAAGRYRYLDKDLSPSVVAGGWGWSHTIIYLEIEFDEGKRVGIGIDMRLTGVPGNGHVIEELLGYR
jgi:hypothetical protein